MRRNSDINVAVDDGTLAMVDAVARQRRTSRAAIVRLAIAAYIEPVPAAPSASPAPPATEARASARARPRGQWCAPRRVPGGREE